MAFKPSAGKKHRSQGEGELNMNSMMDMVTIILLFLLKSYSTEGQLKTASDDLKLPKSIKVLKPQKKPTVEVSKSQIIFDEKVVMLRDEIGDKFLIDPLFKVLKVASDDGKKVEELGGVFDNRVLLIIDEETPFEILTKVMYTCSRAKFFDIRLMVLGQNEDFS